MLHYYNAKSCSLYDPGDQEVLDAALVDVDSSISNVQPTEIHSSQRLSIDEMIQRLAHEQDQRMAHERRPSESRDQPGPSGVRERRESSSSRLGERRASSGGPPTDHSYAVAAQHDPLSPRASMYYLNCLLLLFFIVCNAEYFW